MIAILLVEADGTAVKTTHHLRWTELGNIDQLDKYSMSFMSFQSVLKHSRDALRHNSSVCISTSEYHSYELVTAAYGESSSS